MKQIERPAHPEIHHNRVRQIFDQLNEARAAVQAANKCADPSDAVYYRGALDKLSRLEAQADALTHIFQVERKVILQWVDDMDAYYKALEESSRAKV